MFTTESPGNRAITRALARSQPPILDTPAAAKEAGSASDPKAPAIAGQPAPPLDPGRIACSQGGHPLHLRPFPQSFYRPRYIVLPTGRLIFSWGIWDTENRPLKSLPTGPFRILDFVKRFKHLGKAYAFARKLNEKHERKAVA